MKDGCKWTSNHDCRLCGVDCGVREAEFNPEQAIEEFKISAPRERDEIDEWLEKECHIFAGSCSSIEELKYYVAREVAEKMKQQMIEKTVNWLKKQSLGGYIEANTNYFIEDFKQAMKGE